MPLDADDPRDPPPVDLPTRTDDPEASAWLDPVPGLDLNLDPTRTVSTESPGRTHTAPPSLGDGPNPSGGFGPVGPSGDPRYGPWFFHKQGGIGQVWRVFDRRLGRWIALKTLREDRVANPIHRSRFLREARITAQLQHPGIVPVHDLGELSDGRPYYAMEFLEDRTLREALRAYHELREAGPRPLRDLIASVVAVGRALAYAHARGVIHRDLKPDNVMLGPFGGVYLLDWGLAGLRPGSEASKSFDGEEAPDPGPILLDPASADLLTAPHQAQGTWPYMPPEQADGNARCVDRRSDVYGLGAILYEVLTGRPPWKGADNAASYRRLMTEGLRPPNSVCRATPRALDAACRKALAESPEERYPSVEALNADLEHWLADEPVSADREPLIERLGRWSRRHRPLVASFVAMLAVGVVALAALAIVIDLERREVHAAHEETRQALARADEATLSNLAAIAGLRDLAARRLDGEPEAIAVRRRAAEGADQLLETMLSRRPGDDRLLVASAAVLRELAALDRLTGRKEAALDRLRRAITRQAGTGEEVSPLLGSLHNDLAELHLDSRDHNAAASPIGFAIRHGEALRKARPDDPAGHSLLADALALRGRLHLETGNPDRANQDFSTSEALRAQAAQIADQGEPDSGGRDGPRREAPGDDT